MGGVTPKIEAAKIESGKDRSAKHPQAASDIVV
jgi:hypothetical protein